MDEHIKVTISDESSRSASMLNEIDLRPLKSTILIYQRFENVVLRIVINRNDICYDIMLEFEDPEMRSRALLAIDGSRYPCSCDALENVIDCINYERCCEYVQHLLNR